MKGIIIVIAFLVLSATTGWAQFAKNELSIGLGIERQVNDATAGIDFAHRLGSKKWHGSATYLFVRPQYMYSHLQDMYTAHHIMIPIGIRMAWSNKVLVGLASRRRIFLEAGLRFRATLSAHLDETMFYTWSPPMRFHYDANPITGSDKFGYYAGVGGGYQLGRVSISLTWYQSLKPEDVESRPVALQDGAYSIFYHEYLNKTIAQLMLCVSYTF